MTLPAPHRSSGPATFAACLLLLQLVGRCSAMWQDTHGAKKLVAAMTAESTAERRASNVLRSALQPETVDLERSMDNQLKAIYEDRGSKYYPDGTDIPGNENVGSRPHDPRVPTGFDNPLWAKLHGTENMKISSSPQEDAALDASEAASESVSSGWTYVLGWGETQHQSGQIEDQMPAVLNSSPNKILRRTCMWCAASHAEIYYKRLTNAPSDIMNTLKSSWTNTNNVMGTDFNLYSTYEDAVNGVNAWTYCDFSTAETTMGFPGNCGPSGPVEDQWNLYNPRSGQTEVAFFVEDSNSNRDLNEIEVIREERLRSDRDKYLAEGGCYGLYKLDERRACYRSCHYKREIFDEGTALLCRSLMERGSQEGSKTLMALREYVGDGFEKGGKIKPTHMLGNEDGLPNMGTY